MPMRPERIFASLLWLTLAQPVLARAEGDSCAQTREPAALAEDYCQRHASTPLLLKDPEVRDSQSACKSFYAKAAEAVNLLCEYRSQSADFRDRYAKLEAARPPGQAAETKEMKALRAEASQAALTAASQADQLEFELSNAYKSSSAKLAALNKLGAARMGREMSCGQKGDAGRAPGVFLAGLSTWQGKDEKQTWENVGQAMIDLRAMGLAAANDKRTLLGRPDRIASEFAPPPEDAALSPACAMEPEANKLSPKSIPVAGIVSTITSVIASYPQFAQVKPVITTAWGASLAYNLLVSHEVDSHGLVIVGLSSLASAAFGFEAYTPTSVGLTLLDTAIQNRIREQKTKYLKFVRYRLDTDLSLSSEALGEEWKTSPESSHACQ